MTDQSVLVRKRLGSMAPKVVNKKEKKQQIVQAAISVFARNGFDKTKMIDIAQAAAIGKGTIYEYFRSKDEIFLAAFNTFQQELDDEIGKRIYLLTSPKEKIAAFIRTSFEVYLQSADFVDIMFDFWAEGVRDRHEKIDLKQVYDKYRQYIASILNEGIQSGVFREMNAEMVASLIIAAMDGLALQWIMDKRNFPVIESGEELTQTILRGIEA
ncbi:MAG: TetR/AcrR family transcriptional regulator [bacterium]